MWWLAWEQLLPLTYLAVSMFTGNLIHVAAVVHNVQYGSNIFLKLSDAILDPRGMCERHVSNSRCNEGNRPNTKLWGASGCAGPQT